MTVTAESSTTQASHPADSADTQLVAEHTIAEQMLDGFLCQLLVVEAANLSAKRHRIVADSDLDAAENGRHLPQLFSDQSRQGVLFGP